MSSWGCPHDANGICQRVQGALCAPGMRGCEIEGKVRFANPELNEPRKPVKAPQAKQEKAKPTQAPRRKLPF